MVKHAPKAGAAPIGLGPFGDETEHVGEPEVIVFTPPFRPFFDTDARSVMITLLPQHYNLIPNPAFRVNTTGWEITGVSTSLDAADSWVGQSLVCTGTGLLRYREGAGKFVYVGPMRNSNENQWDFRRGGAEATFSVYVKGVGDVRLTMNAYYPTDHLDLSTGPEYQNLSTVASPATQPSGQSAVIDQSTGRVWKAITPTPTVAPFYEDIGRGPVLATVPGEWTTIEDDGKWHRISIQTNARVPENEGQISFVGARWIDTQIEIRNANGLKVSATMLDPTEYPMCDYFDGGMTEHLLLDDFLWEGVANASVSYYYFDRVIRAKWLYERMGFVAPVNRPFQIFFGSYWRPYVGATGETKMMEVPTNLLNYRHEATTRRAVVEEPPQ